MKHLLFIQPSLDSVGGIEKVIPSVAESLTEADYIVSSYVFYNHVPETQTFWRYSGTAQEVATKGVFRKLKRIFNRFKSLYRFIQATKPDCVIVSAQGAIVMTLLLKRLGLIKVPVVAYIHEARKDGGKIYQILTALFYPLADAWITVSKGIQNEIQSLWWINEKKVYLVYNSLPSTTSTKEIEDSIKKKLSTYQRPLYCTAGRLEKTKGADVLVNACLNYFKNNAGTLLVMGTGSLQRKLTERVEQAGMEERIKFLGRVNNVPTYIKNCDAYLSMARSEPFGLALIEALSVGVKVLATDVPSGPREILSPDEIPESYPFVGKYGILLAPPSRQEQEVMQLRHGLTLFNKIFYKKIDLINRAEMFSPRKQSQDFITVLQKTL